MGVHPAVVFPGKSLRVLTTYPKGSCTEPEFGSPASAREVFANELRLVAELGNHPEVPAV